MNAIELIKKWEGLRLRAYQDSVSIWTIGYGTIRYPNGTSVKQGDTITEEQAEEYLAHHIKTEIEARIGQFVKQPLTGYQLGSLVSFCYNLGCQTLINSTLLKVLNKNPNDRQIAFEFIKFVYAGGKILPGLVNRRVDEALNYFEL